MDHELFMELWFRKFLRKNDGATANHNHSKAAARIIEQPLWLWDKPGKV